MATTRIPQLLEPYIALPPPHSLTLIAGVLGASTNWLVLRYLYTFLSANPPHQSHAQTRQYQTHHEYGDHRDDGSGPAPVRVVLLSFLRDYIFWKDNASRLGVDLDSAAGKGRLVFVDGLTGLFSGTAGGAGAGASAIASLGNHKLTLTEPTTAALRETLDRALAQSHSARASAGPAAADGGGAQTTMTTVLIIDQMDLLVAASGDASIQAGLGDVLLELRKKVHATIVTLSADEPLVQAQNTPLEKTHASLVLSTAHAADLVMSTRLLDTGSAKDVSGVLRITAGGSGGGDVGEPEPDERELLYYLGGDGSAKVFERGQ